MKIGNNAVAANESPAPDGRVNAPEKEVKLSDLTWIAALCHNGPSLATFPFAVSTRFFPDSDICTPIWYHLGFRICPSWVSFSCAFGVHV